MFKALLKARIDSHTKAIEQLANEGEVLQRICDLLIKTFRSGRRCFLAGNGGSESDAQHIAAELLVRLFHNRQAFPVMYIPSGGAIGSAIGNDFSFEEVFSRHVEALLDKGDVLWVLSTSGTSPNILRAAKEAKARGGKVILFTGANTGPISEMADLTLFTQGGRTDLIQEMHGVAYHFVCEQVETAMLKDE